MKQFVVVFIHAVDFSSTVFDVLVLLPCSEVECFLQSGDELVEVGVGHVTASKDVIDAEAEQSDQWWMLDLVAIVISLAGPCGLFCVTVVDQEAAWVQRVDYCTKLCDAFSSLTVPRWRNFGRATFY